MIDTVGFYILISGEEYNRLLEKMVVTQRIDKKTGDIEFEYHNDKINYSWNYNIVSKATDEYWAYDETNRRPYLTAGIPHIKFEYSVPKIIYGNNLVSVSPSLIFESMHKVRESFKDLYGIELPSPNDWYCYRIDTCANFILQDGSQVRNYINYLQRLDYPRKINNSYKDTGLYFASRYNTLKVYCKGEEFKKHDMKRFNTEEAISLYLKAQKILRIEVEHKKSLRYLIGKYEDENKMTLNKFQGSVQMKHLVELFNFKKEMEKIISKFFCGTETRLLKTIDALTLLQAKHSERQARSFHHVYMLIVTQGQKEAKKRIPEGTYYRSLRALRESGISLLASNTDETDFFIDKGFPGDFSLDMNAENKYYQVPVSEVHYLNDSEPEEPF